MRRERAALERGMCRPQKVVCSRLDFLRGEYLADLGRRSTWPPDGLTALHHAANARVAGLLIEGGTEVEALDDAGRSPLHFAAQFGRPDVAGLPISSRT